MACAEGRRFQYEGQQEVSNRFISKEESHEKLSDFGVMAAVLGLGMSALAADNNVPELYAVSQLSTGANLQTMTDSQLTSVEGMSWRSHKKHDGGEKLVVHH